MKAIDFIQSDIKRSQAPSGILFFISLLLVLIIAGIGLGAREGFEEAFTFSNMLPPLLMLVSVGVFPWLYMSQKTSSRHKWTWLYLLAAGTLALSLIQPQTPVSLQKFSPPGSFWPEALHCLSLGIITSWISSLLLIMAMAKFLPLPSKKWQVAGAVLAGFCGMSALTLHCMGPLVEHTLVAHWGQAFIIFPVAYLQFRFLLKYQMKKALGNSKNLQNLEKITD